MLNVFPDLLYLVFFAPTIIRLGLGLVFVYFGLRVLFKDKEEIGSQFERIGMPMKNMAVLFFGVIETLLGILLIIGLFTQAVALLTALISLKLIVLKRLGRNLGTESYLFYFLTLIISLSLLISGAGAFAFDRPL